MKTRIGSIFAIVAALAGLYGMYSGASPEAEPKPRPAKPDANPGPKVAPPAARNGWDYNLTRRSLKSPHPNEPGYYEDKTETGPDGKAWTLVHAGSCPKEPRDQSIPINKPDSPLSLRWTPHKDETGRPNWAVTLTIDLLNKRHPCAGDPGAPARPFTWLVFADHKSHHGGGPFPQPDELVFSANVNYNYAVENGNVRFFAIWSGFWDGKGRTVELIFGDSGWGKGVRRPAPDILKLIPASSKSGELVLLDGKVSGIQAPLKRESHLKVPWHKIIPDLIERGFLERPKNGLKHPHAITAQVAIGAEVNSYSLDRSASASLTFSNFRVCDVADSRAGGCAAKPASPPD